MVLIYDLLSDLKQEYTNTTDTTSGTGYIYPSGAPVINSCLQWGLCQSIENLLCSICVIIVRPAVIFPFGDILCVLLLLRLLITALLSSNFTFHYLMSKSCFQIGVLVTLLCSFKRQNIFFCRTQCTTPFLQLIGKYVVVSALKIIGHFR